LHCILVLQILLLCYKLQLTLQVTSVLKLQLTSYNLNQVNKPESDADDFFASFLKRSEIVPDPVSTGNRRLGPIGLPTWEPQLLSVSKLYTLEMQ